MTPSTVNSRYSGHLQIVVLFPEQQVSVILGVIFSQTSIDGNLNFVRNSRCLQ